MLSRRHFNRIFRKANKGELIDVLYDCDKKIIGLESALIELERKLYSYGETFDSDVHKQFQSECLEIIDIVMERENDKENI